MLNSLGAVVREMGDPAESRQCHSEAAALADRSCDRDELARAHDSIAQLSELAGIRNRCVRTATSPDNLLSARHPTGGFDREI
jgi:hypothetical protein